MGKALDSQVKEYNKMVSSFESRLIVSARSLKTLGITGQAKELPDLNVVDHLPARIDGAKWGIDAGYPVAARARRRSWNSRVSRNRRKNH